MQSRLSAFCEKILEAGWLAAVVVVPLFFNVFSARVFEPDKLSLLRALALLMAATWLVRLWESRPSGLGDLSARLRGAVLGSPLNLLAALLLGAYVLSTALSIVPVFSFWGSYQRLQGFLSVLAYIVIFFIASRYLVRRDQVERLITTVLLTSLPISLYGIIQHLGLDPLPWSGDVTARVTGSMGNAIFFAAYLIMVVPLALGRLVSSAQQARSHRSASSLIGPSLYALLLLVQLVAVLLTKSRGPWLGLLAGLAVFVLLFLLRERRTRQFWAAVGAVLVGLIFIALLNVPGSPVSGLKSASPYLERLGSLAETDSATGKVRLLIWRGDGVGTGALGLVTADPMRTIVGYGPESMQIAYNRFYPPELAHVEARNASPDRSHNDYLDSLVTTGLLGLLAQLALLVAFAVVALRSIWRAEELGQRVVLLALLAAVTAHAVEIVVGIAIAATRTHFWIYLAVVAAVAAGRLQWTPARTPERQGAALAPSAASTAARVRVRKGRAVPRGHASERASRSRAASSDLPRWVRFVPFGVYLLLTVLLANWLLVIGGGRQWDPPVTVIGTFLWIACGVLIVAWQIEAPSAPATVGWRRSYAWLYGLIVLAAAFVTVFHVLAPVTADLYFKRAQAYDDAGRKQQALPDYLNATSWVSYQDYYDVFLGRLLLESAQRASDKPESRQIDSFDDLYSLGRLDQMGREDLFQASLVALSHARELSPLNTDNYANIARLYGTWADLTTDPAAQQERYALSSYYYEQATRLSPNLAFLYEEWAVSYSAQGRFEEARQKLQRAIAIDAAYAPAYARLGDVARLAKDLSAAVEHYNKALSLDGALTSAYVGLGDVLFQQGKVKDAVDVTLKAVRYAPQDPFIRRNLALMYQALNMPDRAISEAQAALRYAPPSQQADAKRLLEELQKPRS